MVSCGSTTLPERQRQPLSHRYITSATTGRGFTVSGRARSYAERVDGPRQGLRLVQVRRDDGGGVGPSLFLLMSTLRAAAWAAALSGIPSTLHALATGRDPLEAVCAAGTILLPDEMNRVRLALAAVPLHLALSFGWALALDRSGVRGAARGAPPGSRSARSTSA